MNNAQLYARGVFTTIAFYRGAPLFWDAHWRRLTSDAGRVGVDLAEHSEESTYAQVASAIRDSGLKTGRVRITFADESPSLNWSTVGESTTRLTTIVAERREISANFRLTLSPYRLNTNSPLAGVKSCNYLEKLLTLDEATSRGFDEAVVLNERGHVASGVMANLFWLKDGELFTPTLATGCLAGTTREFLLRNIKCIEIAAGIETLAQADAIYLTSAGLGVVEVSEFDGKSLTPRRGEIIRVWESALTGGFE